MIDFNTPIFMPKIEIPKNPTSREYLLSIPSEITAIPQDGGITFGPKEVRFMGYKENGEPLYYNESDYRQLGYSFYKLAKNQSLQWEVFTDQNDMHEIKQFYGVNTSALVTDRCKIIIESFKPENIEFIPTIVRNIHTKLVIGEMWFLNVFNILDIFNIEKSNLEYNEIIDTTDIDKKMILRDFKSRLSP